MRSLVVIAHNLRSTHNVGSLLRTAEGLGAETVYLTGYTPYPTLRKDSRLPHLAQKITRDIHKTALGAEDMIVWQYEEDIYTIISRLEKDGYEIIALEQTDSSSPLNMYKAGEKIALVVGSEVTGVPEEILSIITIHVHISMLGKKESFNVVQAAAMALYELRFH